MKTIKRFSPCHYFLHLFVGCITIIKLLAFVLSKSPHYTRSYGTCLFSLTWEISLLWKWDGPRHNVGSRMLAAWRRVTSEPRLENAIQFFPPVPHEATAVVLHASSFQVRSSQAQCYEEGQTKKHKNHLERPQGSKEREQRFLGKSSAAWATIQLHLSSKELACKLLVGSWHYRDKSNDKWLLF